MKETKHWYLPLDKHEAWLRKWILEDHKEWRPNVDVYKRQDQTVVSCQPQKTVLVFYNLIYDIIWQTGR